MTKHTAHTQVLSKICEALTSIQKQSPITARGDQLLPGISCNTSSLKHYRCLTVQCERLTDGFFGIESEFALSYIVPEQDAFGCIGSDDSIIL
jgi:hypothetical protein